MIESQQRTIDGIDFEVRPLPAMKSLETFPRITALLAPLLSDLGSLAKGAQADRLDTIGKALASLARTDPKEVVALTKVLLDGSTITTADGKRQHLLPVIDDELATKMWTLFRLLAFAVEVNYRDFFDVFRNSLGKRKDLASIFQQTSSEPGSPGV